MDFKRECAVDTILSSEEMATFCSFAFEVLLAPRLIDDCIQASILKFFYRVLTVLLSNRAGV